MSKKILTQILSEPLGSEKAVKIDINPGDGNLMIDGNTGSEPILACGTLQYLENKATPIHSMSESNGEATLNIKTETRGQPWMHLPWSACNGATEWQIHLNPSISLAIKAHSDGGNISLNLTGMKVSSVMADTGGGNMEVVLPDNNGGLCVEAKTGAGNVVVRVPGGKAARIHASSGLGKVIMSARFSKIGSNTYQSVDYDNTDDKIEITASSGAGNVSVEERANCK